VAIPFGRWNFAAGELAPGLWGHIDFAKYQIGLSTCRNAFISYRGGAYSRAGTHFVGYSKQTQVGTLPPRLITFQFNINQGICIEAGHHYFRFIIDGAFVLEPEITITNITQSSPAVVTAANSYTNGDWVFLDDITGMTELNGRTAIIGNVTPMHFSLFDVFSQPIDTTSFPVYAGGGAAARLYTLATPWAEQDLQWLKWTQSADVMSICCWNQQTNIGPGGDVSYPAYDLKRITDTNWTLTRFSATTSVQPPNGQVITASNVNTSAQAPPTEYSAVVTTVNQLTGEESQASEVLTFYGSVDISTVAGSIKITWAPQPGQVYYNVYFAQAAVLTHVPPGSLYGYTGTAFGNEFVNTNIQPDFNQVPPLHLDPFEPGQILFVIVTNGGSSLTSVTATITTSTGLGFAGYPIIVGGVLTAYIVTNGGKFYEPGDAIVFNGAAFATGAISFSVNPSNGDTITLNGVVWTFVTSGAAGSQTNIQATLSLTMAQIANDLNASVNPSLAVASYIAEPIGNATNITITYDTAGPAGNSYTLAASAGTPSGPTLTGGGGAGSLAGTIDIGPQTGTYPSAVQYFQQRRFYAATPNQPDTYFASQPGAFNNFDFRIPTIDSDAITGSPWSVQVNGIQWMEPMPGGLVVLTGQQAWQIGGAGSSPLQPQAITPANQQAEAQAFNGCSAYMPPIRKDYDIVYLQALGSIFRDLSYNIYAGIYTGVDITYLSSHLFTGLQMREAAWCEEPYKIIWVTRQDGIRLSFTFFKEQEVLAWARHDTQGLTWSVTSVIEPPVDALYLATQRAINSQNSFMIEREDNRTWDGVETCWCVDAGLSLSQPTPAANLTIVPIDGLGSITAITNFDGGNSYSPGTTLSVLDPTGAGATFTLTVVNGVIQPPVIVTGGQLYTNPKLIFNDPQGIGAYATGTAVISNATTLIADAAVFSPASIGQVVRGASGIAVIETFLDSKHVIANVTQPFQTTQDNSNFVVVQNGQWTMTQPVDEVFAPHLTGATITGIADGQVIPPTVVGPGGLITLASSASQITVGLPFQVQIQTLRPEGGQPTTQGMRKKIGAVTARVENSLGFEIGVNQPDGSAQSPSQIVANWTGMTPVPAPGKPIGLPPYQSNIVPLFTDDVRVPQASGWDKHGQVALQQNQPLPLQLLAVVTEFLEGDLPDAAVSPRPPGAQAGKQGWTV
jgi:hypothetical protein